MITKKQRAVLESYMGDVESMAETIREIADSANAKCEKMSDRARNTDDGQTAIDEAETITRIADELEAIIGSFGNLSFEA